jgi:hypothetical protein
MPALVRFTPIAEKRAITMRDWDLNNFSKSRYRGENREAILPADFGDRAVVDGRHLVVGRRGDLPVSLLLFGLWRNYLSP